MGYDLHITRTRDWLQSHEQPIQEAEWKAACHEGTLLEPHPEFGAGDPSIMGLRGAGAEAPSLVWEDGEVVVYGARGQGDVLPLLQLADRLRAHLVGDDGELYDAEHPTGWHPEP